MQSLNLFCLEGKLKVQYQTNLGNGHSVELGQGTWDSAARSIRNRYETANGGFSPRSSSEIPIDDIVDMVKFVSKYDELSAAQCAEIIQALAESIQRQHP
jgi:hypothetical protein